MVCVFICLCCILQVFVVNCFSHICFVFYILLLGFEYLCCVLYVVYVCVLFCMFVYFCTCGPP